jgi:Protein of unknown function (DUF2510)
MESGPQAGWYPDPAGSNAWRWWDGQAWSNTTSAVDPSAVSQPGAVPAPVAAPVLAAPVLAAPTAVGAPGAVGTPAAGMPGYGPASPVPTTYGYQPQQMPARTGRSNPNGLAFTTFAIVAVYLVLAVTTRIVFIGVLPMLMAIRSQRAREPLAPVALAAAVIALVIGIIAFTHH